MSDEHLYRMPNSSRLRSYVSPLSWAECPSYLLLNSAHVYILVLLPLHCNTSFLSVFPTRLCDPMGGYFPLLLIIHNTRIMPDTGDTGVQQAPMNEQIHWYRVLSSNLGPVGWLPLHDGNAIPCLPRAIWTAHPTNWPTRDQESF